MRQVSSCWRRRRELQPAVGLPSMCRQIPKRRQDRTDRNHQHPAKADCQALLEDEKPVFQERLGHEVGGARGLGQCRRERTGLFRSKSAGLQAVGELQGVERDGGHLMVSWTSIVGDAGVLCNEPALGVRRIAFGNWLTRGLSLARFGRDRFYPLAFETPTGRPPWISLSRAGRVLRTREPETPRCMISTSF